MQQKQQARTHPEGGRRRGSGSLRRLYVVALLLPLLLLLRLRHPLRQLHVVLFTRQAAGGLQRLLPPLQPPLHQQTRAQDDARSVQEVGGPRQEVRNDVATARSQQQRRVHLPRDDQDVRRTRLRERRVVLHDEEQPQRRLHRRVAGSGDQRHAGCEGSRSAASARHRRRVLPEIRERHRRVSNRVEERAAAAAAARRLRRRSGVLRLPPPPPRRRQPQTERRRRPGCVGEGVEGGCGGEGGKARPRHQQRCPRRRLRREQRRHEETSAAADGRHSRRHRGGGGGREVRAGGQEPNAVARRCVQAGGSEDKQAVHGRPKGKLVQEDSTDVAAVAAAARPHQRRTTGQQVQTAQGTGTDQEVRSSDPVAVGERQRLLPLPPAPPLLPLLRHQALQTPEKRLHRLSSQKVKRAETPPPHRCK
eukprot:Rhum_TRINITY_DN15428_c5_g1::Rhum_TRINITY_DN15428_c5_g1_i1::g.155755::m.155755